MLSTSSAEPAAPILEVRDLATVFETAAGLIRAVDDVSFDIAGGETLCLVGESGSGKSALALSIVGLIRPPGRVTGRSVRFKGRELLGLSDDQLRAVRGAGIALVFQEPMTALNPVFTVGAQVAEALRVHGRAAGSEARRQAVALLAAVRMPDPERRARDFPHQLSGGMRQRVSIAIALACSPALVIADEPTTALDATIQAQILDLLLDLRAARGLSLLLVTHDLGVAAGMADRVAVMYAGRLVESAPVATIFSAPQHPYTRGLLASQPGRAPGRRIPAIEGAAPNPARLPRGCAFAPRCPERLARCEAAAPPETVVAPGQTVRCFLYAGETG